MRKGEGKIMALSSLTICKGIQKRESLHEILIVDDGADVMMKTMLVHQSLA